jgi:hypothetical protein
MKKGIYHMINGIIFGFSPSDIVKHVLRFVDTKEELIQDMKNYFGEPFAGQLMSKMGI